MLPVSLAVISPLGRVLLSCALLVIIGTAATFITVHNARESVTIHRASRVALLGVLVSLLTLSAAMLFA